jgi:hypothetical protein
MPHCDFHREFFFSSRYTFYKRLVFLSAAVVVKMDDIEKDASTFLFSPS